jgi:hypothetical protein
MAFLKAGDGGKKDDIGVRKMAKEQEHNETFHREEGIKEFQ